MRESSATARRAAPSRIEERSMRSASTIPDDASSTVWNPRVRARRAEELDALSAELDELAKPLAAYLLMWLYANPDPGWDRRGRRQW